MILWQLFISFAQIGLFSIGGGYAAIPLIQSQAVEVHGWLTAEQFMDLATIAEMTPGPIALNAASFVGIQVAGIAGAVIATLGCILPSLVIVSGLSWIYGRYRRLPMLQSVLGFLRPAVVALIAVPTFNMAKSAHITLSNCWIPIITALLIYLLHVNPVFIILGAGLAGYLYGQYLKSTES